MMKVVQGPEVLLFNRKPSSVKEADLRNMFEKASKGACT